MSIGKPDWWPKNPYPISVFPISEDRYPEIVPDPGLRTALSGMLGRRFWDVASEAIWVAMLEAIDDALWESDDYGRTYCFFCGADHPEHHSNCIYVAAAKLLGCELKVKVGY